jgi:hypothetical protein
LQQARLAQFEYGSEYGKAVDQVELAFMQRLAGDTAGAKATSEQARTILDHPSGDQSCAPDARADLTAYLSQAYAMMGEKDSALKAAECAITLMPSTKDALAGPGFEENLALIQAIVGENSVAISTLTRLLQTPYETFIYGVATTPALLRLDPIWDPLRGDPAFQKLCEEKQP